MKLPSKFQIGDAVIDRSDEVGIVESVQFLASSDPGYVVMWERPGYGLRRGNQVMPESTLRPFDDGTVIVPGPFQVSDRVTSINGDGGTVVEVIFSKIGMRYLVRWDGEARLDSETRMRPNEINVEREQKEAA